ncbi:MAG: marine proteobacterial sortase target protein [Maricaulaceae bacterium]
MGRVLTKPARFEGRAGPHSGTSLGLARFFLILGLGLIGLTLIAVTPALAATPADNRAQGLVRLDDTGVGSLMLQTDEPGWWLEAPRVATDVEIAVAGPIARVRVTQAFTNPSDAWVEGVYVFPLPEDAGVDRLKMIIGERVIDGEIQEKAQARATYEQARSEGRKASLIEQSRPNLFTNSVANIGPGETVVVQIEYQDAARYEDGAWTLRFPLVVAPRYAPEPDRVETVDIGPGGFAVRDPVPDRDAITPPVLNPALEPDAARLPVTLRARIDAGFPLVRLDSLHHPFTVEADGAAQILRLDGAVRANRDVVIEWAAEPAQTPRAALFQEHWKGETYVMAMIAPPEDLGAAAPDQPREAVFIIDNSGSMAGPSIAQAKAALIHGLDGLEPRDRFNVIRFDNTFTALFPVAQPATPDALAQARSFVQRLDAEGGTEILAPLDYALSSGGEDAGSHVRQVILLTDGAVGNEAQILETVSDRLGGSRLFTVGIGSAPNSYFMTRAARLGRGTFTHIGDVAQVQARMAALLEKLERPVMRDLTAAFPPDLGAQTWPDPLPDLYTGEPVVVFAKVADAQGDLTVSGRLAGSGWRASLDLGQAAPALGVANLWARRKIESLESQRFAGIDPETIDAAVLETALRHELVSRLTSLVAVDKTPSRPEGESAQTARVPLELPEGWDYDRVFGRPSAQASPAPSGSLASPLQAAAPPPTALARLKTRSFEVTLGERAVARDAGLVLPQTATWRDGLLFAGGLLLSVGLGLAAWPRRRRR